MYSVQERQVVISSQRVSSYGEDDDEEEEEEEEEERQKLSWISGARRKMEDGVHGVAVLETAAVVRGQEMEG